MRSSFALLALLAGALLPAPARALDPAPAQAADLAEIEACLAGAKDRPETCIAVISNRCQSATPDGATTPGIVDCTTRETAAWDRLLNTRYAAALAGARQADDDLADGASPGAADSLKVAQRAWIAFRDAECDRLYQLWRGGTIRSPVAASCHLEETARRAISLRQDPEG
ncbi:lysozyme inhibitor LprI family protein [Aureimonas pseudogalii]|uniref:Uncharacterized protein YecT (DUF1311 family) n=1 Tax=Aureimonas pseudogalii TaxID=1744844 RepID=A0A7W6MLF7_9HYPH|nr:lysozyme inhibitor LprI family protein [Aureimonas pseudogalii]MBB3999733.1 uncharacterized protein YecT (DUF1311 family) [Aureimonas pseudogalii]